MRPIEDPNVREHFELSTGRRFYANCSVIGLGMNDDAVTYGFDGTITMDVPEWALPEDAADQWTPAEKVELADYMIALWTEWRERASTQLRSETPEP